MVIGNIVHRKRSLGKPVAMTLRTASATSGRWPRDTCCV